MIIFVWTWLDMLSSTPFGTAAFAIVSVALSVIDAEEPT